MKCVVRAIGVALAAWLPASGVASADDAKQLSALAARIHRQSEIPGLAVSVVKGRRARHPRRREEGPLGEKIREELEKIRGPR